MIPMAAFDVPRRWTLVWQLYVFACVWIFAAANPIDMHTCGFYTATPNCGGKDFQATLFYAAAMPTVALFALGQKRIYTVVFALSWIALMGATVVNDRPRYVRNLIIGACFLPSSLRVRGERLADPVPAPQSSSSSASSFSCTTSAR